MLSPLLFALILTFVAIVAYVTGRIVKPPAERPVPPSIDALAELIQHMVVHAGYPYNGYKQMTTEQRAMYRGIAGDMVSADTLEERLRNGEL